MHDYLLLEKELIQRKNVKRPFEATRRKERKDIRALRGSPMTLARVHELFSDEQVRDLCSFGANMGRTDLAPTFNQTLNQ